MKRDEGGEDDEVVLVAAMRGHGGVMWCVAMVDAAAEMAAGDVGDGVCSDDGSGGSEWRGMACIGGGSGGGFPGF
ncbi:hypothetical protein Tco_1517128 [Tanacetum coccineum]